MYMSNDSSLGVGDAARFDVGDAELHDLIINVKSLRKGGYRISAHRFVCLTMDLRAAEREMKRERGST